MPDQVKQQRFSLITDKGVCGELLILGKISNSPHTGVTRIAESS